MSINRLIVIVALANISVSSAIVAMVVWSGGVSRAVRLDPIPETDEEKHNRAISLKLDKMVRETISQVGYSKKGERR